MLPRQALPTWRTLGCVCLIFTYSTLAFSQIRFSDPFAVLSAQDIRSGLPMAVADVNGDGRDDLLRLHLGATGVIDFQQLDGSFTHITLPPMIGSNWALCVGDVDRNGYLDFFTGGDKNGLKLWRGQAGPTYSLSTIPTTNDVFVQGANLVDIDRDGDLDLFVANRLGASLTFSNDGQGNFTADPNLLTTSPAQLLNAAGARGSTWMDLNRDGGPDLYLSKADTGASMPNDPRRRNLLLQQTYAELYTDQASAVQLLPLTQTWASNFADIDNDGDLDAFIINQGAPSSLYVNQNGLFSNITNISNLAASLQAAGELRQCIFQDFNNDGFVDLLVTSAGLTHRLFHNNGNLTFSPVVDAFPNTERIFTAAVGDLNADGFLDLVAGYGSGENEPATREDRLLLNEGNNFQHLRVRLVGTLSNPSGIGARLSLYGPWGVQLREVRSGESFGINHSLTAHFGLGLATLADSLVIRWPSGMVDKLTNLQAGQQLTVTEGSHCVGKGGFEVQSNELRISLTSLSTLGDTLRLWTFGDGDSSRLRNPVHEYALPGLYEVCLTTAGPCGSRRVCRILSITCRKPQALFSPEPNGLTIDFIDISANADSTQYSWDFGDGNTSTLRNPRHTYAGPGGYYVCLTASNKCGEQLNCSLVNVTCSPLEADFQWQNGGLTYLFTDMSSGKPKEWLWTFGDGDSSRVQHPQHTFPNPGMYTVCLTAADECDTLTLCRQVGVNCEAPGADFSVVADGLAQFFNGNYTGTVDSIHWTLGDGTEATTTDVSHTYQVPGNYIVCVDVFGSCGNYQYCDTLLVTCRRPQAGFRLHVVDGLTISVIDESSGGPTAWNYTFGNNDQRQWAEGNYTFAAPGEYQVCQRVSNVCGSADSCQTITVACSEQPPNFNWTNTGLLTEFTVTPDPSVIEWRWDFGDGDTGTGERAIHPFPQAGTYNVCLFANGSCGLRQQCRAVTVGCSGPPTVDFLVEIAGNQVQLSEQTDGPVDQWTWSFGDGTDSATGAQVQHTYTATGTYEICLRVAGPCGGVQACKTITIACVPPTPSFALTTDRLQLLTTNLTTGSADEFRWQFGDGNTSTEEAPTHQYARPGNYRVCLDATNACGTRTYCQILIVSCPTPVAAFTYEGERLLYQFNTPPGDGTTTWLWDFGDAGGSTLPNPQHTFAEVGTYDVCLILSNPCGADTLCQTVEVSCAAPEVDFSAQAQQREVNFTDQSTEMPTQWQWTFGDGRGSSLPNPMHTYELPGQYQVCLTAGNDCGENTSCRTITVTCPAPQTDFTVSADELVLTFRDTSAHQPTDWLWSFGDGQISTEQHPTHTYSQPGSYNVCLQAGNLCGSTQRCRQVVVSCAPPTAEYTYEQDELTVTFNDRSVGGAANWLWNFGDGKMSTEINPRHSYEQAGDYEVCLTVSNECGATESCQRISLSCPTPAPSFQIAITNATLTFLNTTTGSPDYYRWDFGDNTQDTIANAVHTYRRSGAYQVCLTAGNECGEEQSCKDIFVIVTATDEPAWARGLRLFPNPTTGPAWLQIADGPKELRLTVLNGQGQALSSVMLPPSPEPRAVPLDGLPAGMYWLRLSAGGEVLYLKLVVL